MTEARGEYNAITWQPVQVRLGDLDHWQHNPKRLSKAQAKRLMTSTERLGRLEVLSIGPKQPDGRYPLYDGHQRANVWGAAYGLDLMVWALQSSRALTDDERKDVAVLTMTARGSFDWDILSGWDIPPEWGFDAGTLSEWKSDLGALTNLIGAEEAQDTKTDGDIVPEQYGILIECANEEEQNAMLERFLEEGIKCRALLS